MKFTQSTRRPDRHKPPYVTSYEYADLHQLSTLWLGYTDDYRKLRSGSIGSLYHDCDFTRDTNQLNTTGHGIVFRLFDVEHRKARATARLFRGHAPDGEAVPQSPSPKRHGPLRHRQYRVQRRQG